MKDTSVVAKNDTLVKGKTTKKIEIKPNSIINVKSTNWTLNEAPPDDIMVSKCKNWSLSPASIVTIIKSGESINMHDFSYLYYVLPCEIKGQIEIDSSLYSYRVNAGSFFTISNEDTTYFYGCNSPQCRKFFLMGGGNPKDIE